MVKTAIEAAQSVRTLPEALAAYVNATQENEGRRKMLAVKLYYRLPIAWRKQVIERLEA